MSRIATASIVFQANTKRRGTVPVVIYRYPDDRAVHLMIGGKYIGLSATTAGIMNELQQRVVLKPGGETKDIADAIDQIVVK